jgi:hypothetical protein
MLAVALLLAAACAGSSPLGPEQLQGEMRQLGSLDAEEGLLREGLAAHRFTLRFAQAHARYLHDSAQQHAQKLAQASATAADQAELERARAMAGRLEQRFVALMLQLQ